ncbi:MAG: Gfo/Idh/MocA family oxidoreductase [Gammaproteobacteria bacterium]|nr:Gfo/Idh/MocA family oxidoreductase [Gammaproteobacteria bacterium]MCY4219612.1 Gfo/Idh/MocA family oxidoreductase [Gammaproteobacteria bacterium]
MQNKIKVAVVGVGHLGKYHARIYSEMPNVDLVAVMDIDPVRCKIVAGECGTQALSQVESLPSEIDAVSIVVPTRDHLSVARMFLEQGVHTLIEKPLAPTIEEAQKIITLANSNSAILQVGHLERFNPGVIKLKQLAKTPRFIEVHRLGQFSNRSIDIDVVSDLMIHDIDIILSMVDSDIRSIHANGCRVLTDRVDIANARIEFDNKVVANVTASRVSKNAFRRIRVFAHDRYLGLDFQSQQIEEIYLGESGPDVKFPKLIQNSIKVIPELPLNAELEDFIDCVKCGRNPMVSGQEGLMAVKAAAQIQQRITRSMEG